MGELTPKMIETIRGAAKALTGAKRRAFEAQVSLDYLGGDPQLTETVFGWSRHALLLEALLERELREAMQHKEIESLPLYPEGRACRWPTARRMLDLFEPVQRHTLTHGKRPAEVLVTDLTHVQRRLLNLLGLPTKHYGQ